MFTGGSVSLKLGSWGTQPGMPTLHSLMRAMASADAFDHVCSSQHQAGTVTPPQVPRGTRQWCSGALRSRGRAQMSDPPPAEVGATGWKPPSHCVTSGPARNAGTQLHAGSPQSTRPSQLSSMPFVQFSGWPARVDLSKAAIATAVSFARSVSSEAVAAMATFTTRLSQESRGPSLDSKGAVCRDIRPGLLDPTGTSPKPKVTALPNVPRGGGSEAWKASSGGMKSVTRRSTTGAGPSSNASSSYCTSVSGAILAGPLLTRRTSV